MSQELARLGLSQSGVKAELVARLHEHYQVGVNKIKEEIGVYIVHFNDTPPPCIEIQFSTNEQYTAGSVAIYLRVYNPSRCSFNGLYPVFDAILSFLPFAF